jgi:hypothetical protein
VRQVARRDDGDRLRPGVQQRSERVAPSGREGARRHEARHDAQLGTDGELQQRQLHLEAVLRRVRRVTPIEAAQAGDRVAQGNVHGHRSERRLPRVGIVAGRILEMGPVDRSSEHEGPGVAVPGQRRQRQAGDASGARPPRVGDDGPDEHAERRPGGRHAHPAHRRGAAFGIGVVELPGHGRLPDVRAGDHHSMLGAWDCAHPRTRTERGGVPGPVRRGVPARRTRNGTDQRS